MIKINIGCGGRPLEGYENIDMDTLDEIKKRYPLNKYSKDIVVKQYDIFNLPYKNNSIDEIKAEAFIEHLSFIEEEKFFNEIIRVCKIDGLIILSTVDFEKTVKEWLDYEDNWKDFFKNDKKSIESEHWFGNYSYEAKNKWGYITATIYGNQNGEGQFHKNCYTEMKLTSICKKLNLKIIDIEKFRWQNNRDHMLRLIAKKK